jgi:hypothetical protein
LYSETPAYRPPNRIFADPLAVVLKILCFMVKLELRQWNGGKIKLQVPTNMLQALAANQ